MLCNCSPLKRYFYSCHTGSHMRMSKHTVRNFPRFSAHFQHFVCDVWAVFHPVWYVSVPVTVRNFSFTHPPNNPTQNEKINPILFAFVSVHIFAGLLSWDVPNCHVDLEEELAAITQHAPDGEVARHGKFVSNFIFFHSLFFCCMFFVCELKCGSIVSFNWETTENPFSVHVRVRVSIWQSVVDKVKQIQCECTRSTLKWGKNVYVLHRAKLVECTDVNG